MALSIKELIVVLVIAGFIFKLAKPVALLFMEESDFASRRNTYLILTVAAFLIPSFWLFAVVAVPLLINLGRKDGNPAAVYLLLLHVVPPITLPMPLAGMSSIFDVNNYLLLSFFVLLPAAIRIKRSPGYRRPPDIRWFDWAVLGYGLLNSVQYLHALRPGGGIYPLTVTDCMRRAFVFFFITYIPCFVISRGGATRRTLVDCIASYCLASAIQSGIAMFESMRHWLLFAEMPVRWGDQSAIVEYLVRGSALRTMASTGHPLTLGTLLFISCAFWFYLQAKIPRIRVRIFASILVCGGIITTYSRGPWIGVASALLLYIALGRRATSNLVKVLAGIAVVGGVLSLTPLGDRIMSILPFFGGTTDLGSLDYRERLLSRSWEIIKSHPLLGDPAAYLQMADLRQGEGIIDLVNVYVQVSLNDGLLGLAIFLGILLIGCKKINARRRRLMQTDPDLASLGIMLMSCIFGFLVLLAGGSLGSGTERMYYVLGALTAAYAALTAETDPAKKQLVMQGTEVPGGRPGGAKRIVEHRHRGAA
jgi:hypothetical protein